MFCQRDLTPRDVSLDLSEQMNKVREIIKKKSIKNRIYNNKMITYQTK